MQEVQEGKEESDLATIRAWRENSININSGKRYRTSGRTMKDYLTEPEYVMKQDLMRRLTNEAGPRERVTATLIDNDNNTYYRHATYPPEKQG